MMKATFTISGLMILFLAFIAACSISKNVQNEIGYYEQMLDWRQNRLQTLQGPESWPTLAGLYWLSEGTQAFGAAQDNKIVFPNQAPAHIGSIELNKGKVTYQINEDVNVRENGTISKSGVFFDQNQNINRTLSTRSLLWYVIKRGEKYGVRLKDTLHPNRIALDQIPNFPIQEKWVLSAKFIPAQESDSILIQNQVGMNLSNSIKGWIEFKYEGSKHRLTALGNGDSSYFIILSDLTTGNETYGGGRFLYPKKEDAKGKITLDFNKAENPPCVFTDFATCPLPPKENDLPFAILAGEKMMDHH